MKNIKNMNLQVHKYVQSAHKLPFAQINLQNNTFISRENEIKT